MRRTLIAVYLHLIWATWDRLPLLEDPIEREVHRAIQAKAHELGAEPVAMGGVADHVHLLVELPATIAIATLVHDVKGASAHLVTHELDQNSSFKWQGSYAAFSVSPRLLGQAKDYIHRQHEHHAANNPAIHWEHQIFDHLYRTPESRPRDQ